MDEIDESRLVLLLILRSQTAQIVLFAYWHAHLCSFSMPCVLSFILTRPFLFFLLKLHRFTDNSRVQVTAAGPVSTVFSSLLFVQSLRLSLSLLSPCLGRFVCEIDVELSFISMFPSLLRIYMRSPVWRRYRLGQNPHFMRSFRPFIAPYPSHVRQV